MPDQEAGVRSLPCTICGSPAPRESSFGDIVLHRCPQCGHCFTDLTSLQVQPVYDAAWEAKHSNWFAHPNTDLFERISDTIARLSPGSSILDIGAGRGELLRYLRERNPDLHLAGIDVALRPDVEGVEFLEGDVTQFDFGGRRWDAVVSLATIEHVADVRGFARRLHDLLEPNGISIVMTLDERSVLYSVARILNRVGYRVPFERLYDRFHLNHFTSGSLRHLLESAGLQTVEHHHHNIPLESVDMPTDSAILRAGVWGTFVLGRLTNRTYEQTIISRAL